MSHFTFALLLVITMGLALEAAISVNYVNALVYDNNLPYIPTPNPNCTRYLPQVSKF